MPKPHVRSGTLTTRRKRQQREAKLLHDWFQREEARLAEQRAAMARFVAERRLALPDDENCIDTVRLALREPPVMKDRVLLAKRGFELRKNWHRAFKHPDGSVSEPDPGCEHWHREHDDVRVFLWPPCASGEGRCAIEFELARLLGLPNERLHELNGDDVSEGFRVATQEILPWTTSVAETKAHRWAITRIDLVRDFEGDIDLIANAYRLTRWPRVRKTPLPKQMQNGIWWSAHGSSTQQHQLRVYDKGRQLRDTVSRYTTSRRTTSQPTVRVERRWRGTTGLPALIALVEACVPEIRSGADLLRCADRASPTKQRPVPMRLRSLHAALAYEIGLLRPTPFQPSSKDEVLAGAYLRDPLFRVQYEAMWSKRTVRRIQSVAAELATAESGINLLQACYGAQQGHRVPTMPPPNRQRQRSTSWS